MLTWTDYTATTPGAEIRDSINQFNNDTVTDVNKNTEDISEIEDRLAILEEPADAPADNLETRVADLEENASNEDTDHDGVTDLAERVTILENAPTPTPGTPTDLTEVNARLDELEASESIVDVDDNGVSDLSERVTALEQDTPSVWVPTKSTSQMAAANMIVDTYSKSYFQGEPIAINLGKRHTVRRVCLDIDLVTPNGAQNSYSIRIMSSKTRPLIKIIDILGEEAFALGDDNFVVAVDTSDNLVLNITTPMGGTIELILSGAKVAVSN